MHATNVAYACHKSGICMPQTWHMHATAVAYACHKRDICMPQTWHMHATNVVYACHKSGICMPQTWHMHAAAVTYACHKRGICMTHTWHATITASNQALRKSSINIFSSSEQCADFNIHLWKAAIPERIPRCSLILLFSQLETFVLIQHTLDVNQLSCLGHPGTNRTQHCF